MVGTGDIWETPKSASDIKSGNYPSADAPFKSYKCGERGSQIAIIDTMIKNVTDNIVQGWNAFTETITNAVQSNLEADRSKRQVMRTISSKICLIHVSSWGDAACSKRVAQITNASIKVDAQSLQFL